MVCAHGRYALTVSSVNETAGAGLGVGTATPASADAGKFFVSQEGEVSIKLSKVGTYVAKLEAQDLSGAPSASCGTRVTQCLCVEDRVC